ncbi:hypothetical protein [Thermocrispum agreste]|jgi:hypothetical protein|uniref:Uncharacterized protein n=1 Tax=Thermocrispum agreste TaxID=37925 RepID=A0A2W4L0K0_9PSEU|nr:hypothetical protein [Thermocrispum agreste]PZM94459.1 MAG: hypothetical protein DIU77_14165 [Thermocrispum agreste]
MNGSLEVRQFLMRYEGESGTASSGTLPAQRNGAAGDANRITDDQVRRARLAVASSAMDADDCTQLLDMLGLLPGPDGVTPVQR